MGIGRRGSSASCFRRKRRFDVRLAVEEANSAFYAAFTSGSLSMMSATWGRGDHVQCIHPAAGCIAGRDDVLQSWRLVLGGGRLRITLEDVRIFATESYGYVTCVEVVEAGDSRGRVAATNVFEKQQGKWKIVHHHGSPLPGIL
jgi:ketosteroid isomerase-like protein